MKFKYLNAIAIAALCVVAASAQLRKVDSNVDGRPTKEDLNQMRADAREEINIAKINAIRSPVIFGKADPTQPSPNLATISSPFDDPDSFGLNAKFLGALYAGTVYVYHSCSPQILLDELGLTLAADDKCIVHNPPSAPMNSTQYLYDPAWEYTIPKDSIENVLYVVTNNNPGFDSFGDGINPSSYNVSYAPIVTIVSEALNDPAAIDPSTGLPMNGQYTASLSGSRTISRSVGASDYSSEYPSYAGVGSRGFSRSYWQAVGLPNTVINKIFKKKMSLRYGIRVRTTGRVDFGQFYYTLRMFGN